MTSDPGETEGVLLPASLLASRRDAIARVVGAKFAVAILAGDLSGRKLEIGCRIWCESGTDKFFWLRCAGISQVGHHERRRSRSLTKVKA